MKKILSLLCCAVNLTMAYAQNPAQAILQKSLNRINNLKSLSYQEFDIQSNPYSAGDTSIIKAKAFISYDGHGNIKAMNARTNSNNGQGNYAMILRNDTAYQVDYIDSTYTFTPNAKQTDLYASIIGLKGIIKRTLEGNPSKVFLKKDTIINKIACYNFFVKDYDTVENGNHNYTYHYLAISKSNLMPVYFKELGNGTAMKDGHVIGRLSFYVEQWLSKFKIDEKLNQGIVAFDKSKFSPPNKQMLSEGTKAPPMMLKDINNRSVNPGNKLLLLEFGGTMCGANPLANPVLNRLHKKYESADFSIVSIYTGETPAQVKQYINANKLLFPVYLSDLKTRKAFKTVGTPNFYLVDKSGTIVKSLGGYDDDMERELSKLIDKELAK